MPSPRNKPLKEPSPKPDEEVDSDPGFLEEDEFIVDCILHEVIGDDGEPRFLIKWYVNASPQKHLKRKLRQNLGKAIAKRSNKGAMKSRS